MNKWMNRWIISILICSLVFSILSLPNAMARGSDSAIGALKKADHVENRKKKLASEFKTSEDEIQKLINQGYNSEEIMNALNHQKNQSITLDKALGKAKLKTVNRSTEESVVEYKDNYLYFTSQDFTTTSSPVENPVSDETIRNLNYRIDQAPYLVGSSGESISTLDGSLNLSSTDFILPGRNGLSFALTRAYNSNESQFFDISTSYSNDNYDYVVYYNGSRQLKRILFAPTFEMTHWREYESCLNSSFSIEIIGDDRWELETTYAKYDDAYQMKLKLDSTQPTYTSSWSACASNTRIRDKYIYKAETSKVEWVSEQTIGGAETGQYNSNIYETYSEASAEKTRIDNLSVSANKLYGSTVPVGTNSTEYIFYDYYVSSSPQSYIYTFGAGNWYPVQSTISTYDDTWYPIGKGWSWDLPYVKDGKYVHLQGGGTYEISGSKLKGYVWDDITITTGTGTVTVNGVSTTYYYTLSTIDGIKQYFNSSGNIIKITDAYNNYIDFVYSSVSAYGNRQLLTSIRDPLGNQLQIQYTTSEVTVTYGSKTVRYQKTSFTNSGKNIELLDRVIDAQNRVTRYEYAIKTDTRYNMISTNVSGGVPNGYALLKTIYHPTGAETGYQYETFPITRYVGPNAVNQQYRIQTRENRIISANPDYPDQTTSTLFNHVDFSYTGDVSSAASSDLNFSSIQNDGLNVTTYNYFKDYFDANTSPVFYLEQSINTLGQLETIQSYIYDRTRKLTVPNSVTTVYKDKQSSRTRTVTTSQTFDNYGNKLTATNPEGVTVTYTYHPSSHLVKTILQPIDSARKVYTETTKTAQGDLDLVQVKENNASGALLQYTDLDYDAYGNIVKVTSKRDRNDLTKEVVQNTEYNSIYYYGFATKQTISGKDADGNPFTITVDAEYDKQTGAMTKFIDGNRNATTYRYDKLNRIELVTNPDASTITIQYDDLSNKVTMTNEIGAKTETRYNPLGIPVQEGIYVNGTYQNKSSKGYDTYGRLIWTEDAELNRSSINYSLKPWGSEIVTTLPDNSQSIVRSNVIDMKTINIDALGNSVEQQSDIMGRVWKTTETAVNSANPALTSTNVLGTSTFDYSGNVQRQTDAKNQVTTYSYDFLGRLTSVLSPLNEQTQYQYDLLGNLMKVLHPDNSFTVKTYDELGRVITGTDQEGKLKKYYYDNNGNMVRHIDRNGNTLTFAYDSRNRMLSRSDGLTTDVFTYTLDGLRSTMADGTGTTAYTYDPYTRKPIVITYPDQQTLTMSYDVRGNMTSLINPFGENTGYHYDGLNRLDSINNGMDALYSYYNNGAIKQVDQGNGVVASYVYEGLKLTSLTYTKPDLTQIAYGYDYDANKNISALTRQAAHYTFEYDAMNRIEQSSQNHETYTYDHRGNRQTLQSDMEKLPTSDQYEYDRWNRLSKVTKEDGTVVTYKYYGDNLMVERTENGATTRYYYAGSNIIAEGRLHPDGSVMQTKKRGGVQNIGCAGGTNLRLSAPGAAQPNDRCFSLEPGRIKDLTAVDADRRATGSFQPRLTVIPGHIG